MAENVSCVFPRRQFLRVVALAGAAAAVPPFAESFLAAARAGEVGPPGGYFFTPEEWSTAAALAARIVPTGSDPATDPGATEARAVVFADRFLAAFQPELAAVADGPPLWVRGRWSGRNPFPTADGQAGGDFPPDDFLDSSGVAHFLPLTPAQRLSWQVQLYGTRALAAAPGWARAWAAQVGGPIPAPTGLRAAYRDGLAAFDTWSESMFGTRFASASTEEQDIMLAGAGNVVLDAASGSIPGGPPSPPLAPAAASELVPIITLHTFQAVYGIPEYAWRNQDNDPTVTRLGGSAEWRAIGYDGDTQPLGNSLFDADLYAAGEGPNEGFGAEPGSPDAQAGVFVPFGGYREYRPVSGPGPGGTVIGPDGERLLKAALAGLHARRAGR